MAYFFDTIQIHLQSLSCSTTMIHFYKAFIVYFFIALAIPMQGQTAKLLKGKVVANSNDLEGIYIVNIKSDLSTLTENGGYFSIPAK